MSLGFVMLALTAAGTASAATYYVSDCQAGAAGTCVAGNDSNAGTSAAAPWKSTAKVTSAFGNLAAGDKVLFARGGSWSNASLGLLQNLKASAANPITLDSYAPAWGGTAKPILLETRSGYNLISFDDSGSPEADGGYVVNGLDLRGGGSAQWGIFTSQLTSDITLTNLNIEGFAIGIHCGTAIQRVKLQNSTLKNNRSQGILWGCANSLVENTTFDNNGYESPPFDHPVYMTTGGSNTTLRGNTFINNALEGGVCKSTVIVAHGVSTNLTIENNLIYQAAGTSNSGCWGIAIDTGYGEPESFTTPKVRGNTIVNAGGYGIGCSACISPLIENNVIVSETASMVAIAIPDRSRGSDDAADSGAIIRNNSIYFGTTPQYSQGISVTPQGGSTIGSNAQVVSNLIYFGGAAAHSNHQCFAMARTTMSNFAAFNNNLCYTAAGNGAYSDVYSTLAAAKAAAFDLAGLAVDPKLAALPSKANNWALTLSAGSPAINAGNVLSSTVDRLLSLVRSVPDIGAFEYSAGTSDKLPPGPPASVIIQ